MMFLGGDGPQGTILFLSFAGSAIFPGDFYAKRCLWSGREMMSGKKEKKAGKSKKDAKVQSLKKEVKKFHKQVNDQLDQLSNRQAAVLRKVSKGTPEAA
ncbi:MAG: hypothetical protein HQL56_07775 [Magnetococcales bacterium]|nr:hypothetical protein [Magnetococcales bacterium]